MISSWPADAPLAVLWSGGEATDRYARWTVIAMPREMLIGGAPPTRPRTGAHRGASARGGGPPFKGGWIGCVSYDWGRRLEPRAACDAGAPDDRGWPTMAWARVDDALVLDRLTWRWWVLGDPPARPAPAYPNAGLGPLRFDLALDRGAEPRYRRLVERALEYIRAGDVYQVNLAHRITGGISGSARRFFGELMTASAPWFGAYLEFEHAGGRRAIASASPELFLRFDAATGEVLTRPMKGTRPAACPETDLLESAKDRAELAMIVDLMRNDIGRVCRYGSVRVEEARTLERHGAGIGAGVLQTVATVRGVVAPGLGALDVLGAAFPPGSVTGAPKVRAMQIIDQLEEARRGPYCGAIGYLDDSGDAQFSVAIRTAAVTERSAGRSVLDYWVGAGIVAESDPGSEWRETMDKAGVLLAVLGRGGHAAFPMETRA